MTSNARQQPDHDLERLLHALGDRLDLPQMGDSASTARARIEARPLTASDARSSQVFGPYPDEDEASVSGPVLVEDGVLGRDRRRSRVRELALLSAGIAAAAIVAVGLAIVFGGWPGADDETDGPAMAGIPGVEPYEIPGYEFVRTVGGPTVPNDPSDIAVGDDGRIYVADPGINRIVAFTSDGEIDTSWGQDGFSQEIDQPKRLAIADDGTLWVAGHDATVYQMASAGDITSSWVLPEGGRITGLAVDHQGNVYLANESLSKVQGFQPDGTLVTEWVLGGVEPIDLTIDAQDLIYVVYHAPATSQGPGAWGVRVFDATGNERGDWDAETGLIASDQGVLGGVVAGSDGNIYLVRDPQTSELGIEVVRITPGGDVTVVWQVEARREGLFAIPSIGATPDGRVLLADANKQRIIAVDQGGAVSTVVQADGTRGFASLWRIDVGAGGDIYALDPYQGQVLQFVGDGTVQQRYVFSDLAPGRRVPILESSDVAVDEHGNVYVAAYNSQALLVFGPDGQRRQTMGGLGEISFTDETVLFSPYGVDVASNGEILVTDEQSAGYIKRYSAEGEYLGRWLATDENTLPVHFEVVNDEVYVQYHDQLLRVYDIAGNLLREISIAGTSDAGSERSFFSFDVAEDGTIYALSISFEQSNEDGQIFTEFLTISPQGEIVAATMLDSGPGALALRVINLGPDGKLYVSDPTAKQILVYQPE